MSFYGILQVKYLFRNRIRELTTDYVNAIVVANHYLASNNYISGITPKYTIITANVVFFSLIAIIKNRFNIVR